jgi:hypothetical protein
MLSSPQQFFIRNYFNIILQHLLYNNLMLEIILLRNNINFTLKYKY